ncbi:uncharacterized protein LOC122421315 [Cervus canadensis]|uniref:uncharacterized protein LOC122421315 n=1 Tax=Cervus canadensis TaxID=1574408 RepID=UPI001CA332F4|nr:uncharacterized protein LOC122421315 [Cervus canadensis]
MTVCHTKSSEPPPSASEQGGVEGYGASAFFSCSPPSDSSVHASWRNGAFGTALGSNAKVDLGSSNSFLLLGLAAGGFGQALQRNQPVEDVCVRAIWRPAVPRGPAWRRRVSGSPQATTRAAASTCLVIYRDRQPTSAAAARPTQTTELCSEEGLFNSGPRGSAAQTPLTSGPPRALALCVRLRWGATPARAPRWRGSPRNPQSSPRERSQIWGLAQRARTAETPR